MIKEGTLFNSEEMPITLGTDSVIGFGVFLAPPMSVESVTQSPPLGVHLHEQVLWTVNPPDRTLYLKVPLTDGTVTRFTQSTRADPRHGEVVEWLLHGSFLHGEFWRLRLEPNSPATAQKLLDAIHEAGIAMSG